MRNEPARRKLLLLEADWRAVPGQPARSVSRLYAAGMPGLACARKPLSARSLEEDLRDFAGLPENRSGPNVVVISAHAVDGAQSVPCLCAGDGLIPPGPLFASLGQVLRRSLVILDACHLGSHLPALRSHALGMVGFRGQVDWLASSVFVLALLRAWQRAGVFDQRRAHPARARNALAALWRSEYATLMRTLGVAEVFAR